MKKAVDELKPKKPKRIFKPCGIPTVKGPCKLQRGHYGGCDGR